MSGTEVGLFVTFSLVVIVGCAHPPPPTVTRVDTEWLQPQVDETAAAASRCLRGASDRVVEIEASAEARVRAWVYPFPPSAEVQRCVDAVAVNLRVQPAQQVTRSLVRGDGRPADPSAPRQRALALRARLLDGIAPVEVCRTAWQARRPGARGRVVLSIAVGRDGTPRAEVAASSVDPDADRCVAAAVNAMRLPPSRADEPPLRFPILLGARAATAGMPDLHPIDPWDFDAALAAIRPATDGCMAGYKTRGQYLLHVTVGPDGAPTGARIERAEGPNEEDDRVADACLRRAAMRLRVPPFDGPPQERQLPFHMR